MIAALLALTLACQADGAAADEAQRPCRAPASANWRVEATPEDRSRLRGWHDAWQAGLDQARAAAPAAIAAEGALFDADRALPNPLPPPGSYRCRTFKLGAKSDGMLPFVAYPAFTCRIDAAGALLRLTKLTGSQRPVGTIYPDEPARAVFLGTLELGDERGPSRYGRDRLRDLAGFVERIGDRRWRLTLPSPAFESLTDVIELVPAE